jgi:hypothetical protein
MASTLKLTQIQLGTDVDSTKNFVLQTNENGTASILRGNVGSTTQEVFKVDEAGKVSLPQGLTNTALVSVTTDSANNVTGGSGGQLLVQSAAGVTNKLPNGSAGQVLQSAGGTSLPTWATPSVQAHPGSLINVQVFTASGTYTPTIGTAKIFVEVLGPGAPGASGSDGAIGVGGQPGANGGSGCLRAVFVQSNTPQSVTVGASNGTSSFGTLITGVGRGVSGTGGFIQRAGMYSGSPAYGSGPGGGLGSGASGNANTGGGGVGGVGGNAGTTGKNAIPPTAGTAGGAGGSGLVVVYEYT